MTNENEKIKAQRDFLLLVLILGGLFIFISTVQEYKYNKCVSVNKENWQKCINEGGLRYDCSVFENPEERCWYY